MADQFRPERSADEEAALAARLHRVAPPSFTCPRCRRTSYHPEDVEHGYCGHCHDFTGQPTR